MSMAMAAPPAHILAAAPPKSDEHIEDVARIDELKKRIQKQGSNVVYGDEEMLLVTPICTRGQVYPQPLATHDEVLRDPTLFMDTLVKFHEAMGSRMTSPRMGGNQLDLYRLYKEVTSRGGLEQVIKDRIWKDIKAVFNFPRTTTSASFVLRKYYTSLLHHYEQVYFFKMQGPLVPPPAPLPAPSPVLQSPEHRGALSVLDDNARSTPLKQQYSDVEAAIGTTVAGSIQEKFEHGYLVTVMVGTDKCRGVLYESTARIEQHQEQQQMVMKNTRKIAAAAVGEKEVVLGVQRKRRRLGLRKRDPNAPKLNRSGYNFFFAEQRARLKQLHPDKEREMSKMIGELWSSLSQEEKSPYQERGVKDKDRYKKEMNEYREGLNTQLSYPSKVAASVDDGNDGDGDEGKNDGHCPVSFNKTERNNSNKQLAAATVPSFHAQKDQHPTVAPIRKLGACN